MNEKGISMDGDGKNFKVMHVSSFKKMSVWLSFKASYILQLYFVLG